VSNNAVFNPARCPHQTCVTISKKWERFELLTAASISTTVLGCVTPCTFVHGYRVWGKLLVQSPGKHNDCSTYLYAVRAYKWRLQDPWESWYLYTRLHGVTFAKFVILLWAINVRRLTSAEMCFCEGMRAACFWSLAGVTKRWQDCACNTSDL